MKAQLVLDVPAGTVGKRAELWRKEDPATRAAWDRALAMEAFPFTLGRSWLERERLMHLLPDPHGHSHIYDVVDDQYPRGAAGFAADFTAQGTLC